MYNKFEVVLYRFHMKKKNTLLIKGYFEEGCKKNNSLKIMLDQKELNVAIDEEINQGIALSSELGTSRAKYIYELQVELPGNWEKGQKIRVINCLNEKEKEEYKISVAKLVKNKNRIEKYVECEKVSEKGFVIKGWCIYQNKVDIIVKDEKKNILPVKIKIEHLTKIFGKRIKTALTMVEKGEPKNEILKKTGATVGVYDTNFEINEGEIFVIMGLSGSGKSTLLRLLNRLIEPTSGKIFIDNQDVATLNKEDLLQVRRKTMSMVFQNFGLFPHRTILENTEYGLEVQNVPKEERRKRAEKALDNANLLDFKDQYPKQLSGGMQQRVGLARALANDPEILLMDEAFSALDPLIRREMQDELLELQAKFQKTIIFVSHDLNEALRIGDRIAIMKDGKIMQIGTGEEILTNPANDYVKTFVEDVDRAKVITAENIMIPALTTNIDVDGPSVALKKMKTEEVSSLMAVDKKRQFRGVVTSEQAIAARKNNQPLKDVMTTDVGTVSKEMLVRDILPIIYDAPTPLAVVDDNGFLKGVLIRGSVLEALADIPDEDEVEEIEKEEENK